MLTLVAPNGDKWVLAAGPNVVLNGPRGGRRSVREIENKSLKVTEIKVVEK